jgi:hypothetical protein
MRYNHIIFNGEKHLLITEEQLAKERGSEAPREATADERELRSMVRVLQKTILILSGEEVAPSGHHLFIGPHDPGNDQPDEPF